MAGAAALQAHLATGTTTVARAWAVIRRDGVRMGFTDHDGNLEFDGLTFRADTGLSARALQQGTGLAVDNSEAMGALRDDAIAEADIAAGRFDGAEVIVWLVNWAAVAERKILFRGRIGDIRRGAGAFHAELRGLTEALNRPMGRVFQKSCSAALGDASCGVDLSAVGLVHQGPLASDSDGQAFALGSLAGYAPGWFQRGRLVVLDGVAAGLSATVKQDRIDASGVRIVALWEPLRVAPRAGDTVRLTAGCDKRFDTCRAKFGNTLNFRGFPDLPDEDWLMVHPGRSGRLAGGSRR